MRGFYRGARKPGSGKFCAAIVSRETEFRCGTEDVVSRETEFIQKMNKEILFTYTKLPEDYIEDIFHIHPAQQPSQRMGRHPKVLRSEFLSLP